MDNIFYRFGYYIAGLAIGIILVVYINKQKNVTFDYMPNARTLKQIRLRDTMVFSNKAQLTINELQLDSTDIAYVLHKGDVDFKKSHVQVKPCPDYWIDATIGKKIGEEITRTPLTFIIKRCEYVATVEEIIIQK